MLLRSSTKVRPSRPTTGVHSDLHYFRPNVVQRVKLHRAEFLDRRVRVWLLLQNPVVGIFLSAVMLASFALMAPTNTEQIASAQFAAECIIAVDWLARLVLALALTPWTALLTRRTNRPERHSSATAMDDMTLGGAINRPINIFYLSDSTKRFQSIDEVRLLM